LNESENIENLVMSINTQDYRPVEVIIVDDGSTDNTLSIVTDLANALNSSTFEITLFETRHFGHVRGPSAARNIGLKAAKGDFIYWADADFLLTQNNFLSKLSECLVNTPVISFHSKVIVDNWLEHNQAIDYGSLTYHGISYAFRKDVIKKFTFDQELGMGEDRDLISRLNSHGLLDNAFINGIEVGLHYPHSLKKYRAERFWHGKSFLQYLKKFPNRRNYATLIIRPFPIILIAFSIVFAFFYPLITCLLLASFLGLILWLLYKSPVKTLTRPCYIVLRLTYGTLWFTLGLFKGAIDLLKGSYQPGRDP
jgi:glycosyltransferase involved in cell wall biosynthesis